MTFENVLLGIFPIMKKTILLFVILFCINNSFSQTQESLNDYEAKIDGLKMALSKTRSDSLRCILNFKIADFYRKWNKLEDYKSYKDSANALVGSHDYLKGISYFYNAYDHILKGDYEAFLSDLIVADKRLKKYAFPENYALRAILLNNQVLSYQRKGDEKEGFRILTEEAMPLAEKGKNPESMGFIYGNMALISHNSRNYEKSEYFYKKAIEELEKEGVFNQNYLVDCYIFYGRILIKLEKHELLNELLIKIEHKLEPYPNSTLNSKYYYLKGYRDFYAKDYERALKTLNQGIDFTSKTQDKISLLSLKLLKSNTLMELKKYEEARDLLIEYLSDPNILIGNKRDFTRNLALVYISLNDNKNALKYFERFSVLSDSLDEVTSRNAISKFEAEFNKIENEKKIGELEAEKKQATLILEKNRINNVFFGLFSALLLIIVILLWKNVKTQKHLAIEKENNYHQNVRSLKDNRDKEIMGAIIESEEAERTRVARDLHDGIGSRLSALKMKLDKTQYGKSSYNHPEILGLLANSIEELKQVSYNLMPETLLKLGLESALKDLCHSLSTKAIAISFQANSLQGEIIKNHQIAIYRIVQELVNNALKHSGCSEIIVDCQQNGTLFLLTVEDNGVGFDAEGIHEFAGLGLKNIKNRVDLLNGKIELKTQIGKGVIYNIELLVSLNNEQNI